MIKFSIGRCCVFNEAGSVLARFHVGGVTLRSDDQSKRKLSGVNEDDGYMDKHPFHGGLQGGDCGDEVSKKKIRLEAVNGAGDDGQTLLLSPEQKCRVNNNRIKAKIVLASKRTSALHSGIGPTWFAALESEFSKPYFLKLSDFLDEERKRCVVYPTDENVYSWTKLCPINQVKVVILGQDPYHNKEQAHGLCFSVPKGVTTPPSLVNIYKELVQDIPGFEIPSHGNLTDWAKQGVLLLNAVLTVRANTPNSHKERGWEELTNAVIKYVGDHLDNVVFMLWGQYAQKKASVIKNNGRHLILKCAHPSPFSATRFFGCRHFSQANDYLKKHGKMPINWCLS